jgi:hypothetical protein
LVDPAVPPPLRSLAPVSALLVLLMGILELALSSGLITGPLADWMAGHGALPSERRLLHDSAPNDNPSALGVLPVPDRCLAPAPIIGTLALIYTCVWPTHYLQRPQLLTRV